MRVATRGSRRFARLARTASARSLIVLALIGVVTGCAGPPSSPSGSGTASPELQLRYSCGTFAFDPAFLDRAGNAEQAADPIAMALREHLAIPGPEFDMLPDTGWLLVGADSGRAELVARDRLGSLMSVSLENARGGWKVTGWGGCEPSLALPPGLNRADWFPDPEHPEPDAATRAFMALVTERECASGQSSVGRVVGPVVLFDASQVLVAFAVRPLPGGIQACPSNPPTPVLIDLGQPLGDRALIDAGHLPFVDVREGDPDF